MSVQSPNADRVVQLIADCEDCVVEYAGWRPRQWTIEACESHHALLCRECDSDE